VTTLSWRPYVSRPGDVKDRETPLQLTADPKENRMHTIKAVLVAALG